MGIPVVDLFASYSFAKVHPYWTVLMIAVLIALAWLVLSLMRKFPMVRFGFFAVYLAIALPLTWAAFKAEPSPMSQVMDAAHEAQLLDALHKEQQKNHESK